MKPLSLVQKELIYKWIVNGPFRAVAGPAYALTIASEIAVQRGFDWVLTSPDRHHLLGEVTALIKTFERPRQLRSLVRSIKRRYPSISIVVVDDSENPTKMDDVQTVILPYDSGVSAGRSEGLRSIATRYVINLDDDFVFYHQTDLISALTLLDKFEEIDIMGGEVVDLPLYIVHDYARVGLYPTEAKSVRPADTVIGGMPTYDKVSNFFVARTERLRMVDWDRRLKRLDHADFFTRAKGILLSVFNKKLRILHAKTPFDSTYLKTRMDLASDNRVIAHRYYRATQK